MQIMKRSKTSWPLSGRILCLVLAMAAAFTPTRVLCQNSSSAINGVVTDSGDAVIPGAKVTLRNVDTNVERITVSNSAGDYFFSSVPPARYTLTFAAPNFQTETIAAFEVAVAQAVTINASLKVGDVSQSVTVEAAGTQVESSTAQLGTVIGEKAVNDLPLNGRNFTQLLTLTPGRNAHQHRPELERRQYRRHCRQHDELRLPLDQWRWQPLHDLSCGRHERQPGLVQHLRCPADH